MGQYELKTIYTNYAKELMCNTPKIPAGNENNMPFYFTHIIISPQIREMNEDIDDIGSGYRIDDLEVTTNKYSGGLEVVIKGDIGENVTGVHMGCMGLYIRDGEKVDGQESSGQEHLFAVMFGSGYDIKPSDIGYDLEIHIKFRLQEANIPSSRFPELYVIIKPHVSVTDVNKATATLLYEVENLERCIDYNATKEGMNFPQVQYLRQQKLNRNLIEYSNTLKLVYLNNKIRMDKCENVFFPMDLLSLDEYTVTNYVIDDLWKDDSKLLVEAQNYTFRSMGDGMTFNQPFTLSMFLNINTLNNNFILCKADTTDNDFTKWYMRFYVEDTVGSDSTTGHRLVFQIYGNNGSIINTYTLTNQDIFDIREYYVNLVYTFNGDNVVPVTQLYWNGVRTDSVQELIGSFDYVADASSGKLMNYEVYGGNNFEYSEGVLLNSIMFFNDVLEPRDLTYMAKINGSQTLPIIEF